MSNTAGKHVVPKGEGHVNCYYDVIYGPNRFVVVASYAVIFIYSSSYVVYVVHAILYLTAARVYDRNGPI